MALGTAAVTTEANFETTMSSVKALISSSSTDIEGDIYGTSFTAVIKEISDYPESGEYGSNRSIEKRIK